MEVRQSRRGSDREIRIGELQRRGHRGFPNNSRQSMNHMQMTPKTQAPLGGGGGMAMGTPALVEANPWPLWTPSPARSRAGRDRADFKPQQWAGSIYKLSRKRHSHAHTKPQPPPSPMLLGSAGKGWGAVMTTTPFFQGSLSSQQAHSLATLVLCYQGLGCRPERDPTPRSM